MPEAKSKAKGKGQAKAKAEAKAEAKAKVKANTVQDTGLPALPGLRERPEPAESHRGQRLPPLPQVAKLLLEVYHARNGDDLLHGDLARHETWLESRAWK